MAKLRKRRVPKEAIVLSDITFKLGVKEVRGTIAGQQGIACFISEEEHLALPLPFAPPISAYGEVFTAFIRSYDQSLVLELGEDDILTSRLGKGSIAMDVTDPAVIGELFEEQKLRRVPQALSGVGSTIGAIIVALITFLFKLPTFPFVAVPACIGVFGIQWLAKEYRTLSRSVVYDSRGNWINLATGRTSLNNGEFRYKIEVESDDCDEFKVSHRRRK